MMIPLHLPDLEKDTIAWNNAWENLITQFSKFVWAVDGAD